VLIAAQAIVTPPVVRHSSFARGRAQVKMAVKDYQSKRKALEAQEGEKAATA